MTAQQDHPVDIDDLKAKLHHTFPGPGAPVPPGHDTEVPLCQRPPITDKVVFGVTAVLVLAILGWGLIWPAPFGSTMSSILDWVVSNLGWLFIVSATCFVLFAAWLALSRYGRIPLGAGRGETRVQHRELGRDDVQRRHGHRPDLLGRHRTADAFRQPATWARRFEGGHRAGDGPVPLGIPPVVDVCRRRLVDRLRQLPDGAAAADQRRRSSRCSAGSGSRARSER